MQLFYAYHTDGLTATLDPEETRHCTRTLRKKAGDIISFTDGYGNLYEGEIIDFTKKNCHLKIRRTVETKKIKKFSIHLGIAPTKNINRLEWFLEKTTELGIDHISPLLCQRSERKKIRPDRLQKIILSAAKQSLNFNFPVLNELTNFEVFVKSAHNQNKYIAHCNSDNLPHLKSLISGQTDTLILIGPEGDFSIKEVELAKQHGFVEVSLGSSRLRTETAGIVACHTVHLANE